MVVAVVACVTVTVRYVRIRSRLATDPVAEVARLTANPAKRQRAYFGGDRTRIARPRAGEFSEDFDPNAPDPYAAMRDVDVLGQKSEASQDRVNRTEDPHRGEIE